MIVAKEKSSRSLNLFQPLCDDKQAEGEVYMLSRINERARLYESPQVVLMSRRHR